MILLNWFSYLYFTLYYTSLHIYIVVNEDIANEHRLHTKYTGMVNPYVPNSFGSSVPWWPHNGGLSLTWVSAIIIYIVCVNYTYVYVPLINV